MSKEAKKQVGYEDKPVLPVCKNCKGFTSEKVLPQWMKQIGYSVEQYGVEKNIRCSVHGFEIKKMGSCLSFSKRGEA
jgi:hypothetical protein